MSKITIKTEPHYTTALVVTYVKTADENGEAVYEYEAGERQSVRVRRVGLKPFEGDIVAEKNGVISPILAEDVILERKYPPTLWQRFIKYLEQYI